MHKAVTITGSGQITLPAEIRRKHGLKAGDQVLIVESADGRIEVKPKIRTAEDFAGIFKLRPGVKADADFDNLIREAMDESADRTLAEMDRLDADE